jgi:hypothetical protein
MTEEMKNLETEKKEIQKLGLNAIREYFKIDVGKFDAGFLKHLHQKATLGMTFEKEMNLSKRAVEMNYIRVFRLIAEDKKEIRRLIKKSIPQYLP